MQQDNLTPYLRLLSSDYEAANENAAKFIILQSTINPQMMLSQLHDIYTFINSLTSADHPKWGVISSILIALSNSINLTIKNFAKSDDKRAQDQISKSINQLIKISQVVTQSYFLKADESCIQPFLLPFSQSICKIFIERKSYTRDILNQISDHCTVGFVPGASFVPALLKTFDSFRSQFQSSPIEDFSKLSQPLLSPSKDVVIFFLTLWSCSLPDLIKIPEAIQALRSRTRKILSLIEEDQVPFRSPATYIFDCTKAFTQDFSKLIQRGKECQAEWITALKNYINFSIYLQEETSEVFTNVKNKNKATTMMNRLIGTQVEMFVKKKPKKFYLYYLQEPKIFAWSPSTDMKQAQYLHATEIESAFLDSKNQNMLNIRTYKKENYQFQFLSTQVANEYCEALSSA